MIHIDDRSFPKIAWYLVDLMTRAQSVKTERWQGMPVNTDTREMRNVCFTVDLMGVEDLDHWRKEVQPNLPWADDHFLERVGGEPLNPGVQWMKWPWGQSANKFRGPDEVGPKMAPQDWAYLAGMIDGEGTIYYQKKKLPSFQGVVRVYQKERKVLDFLRDTFRVGDVNQIVNSEQVLNGTTYQNIGHQWAIGSILEIRWVLNGVLPYLQIKKERAEEILKVIGEALKIEKKQGTPVKKVWGRDWPTRFNHTYMCRLWPRKLDGGSVFRGHGWEYGDLNSLVDLLAKEPHTRQGVIPLFYPEDTGVGDGGRKMCSLLYQVMVRDKRAHMYYPLRSCDLRRHFRDDAYLAIRMLLWITEQCRDRSDFWHDVRPGSLSMHMTSLHIFENDYRELREGKWQ